MSKRIGMILLLSLFSGIAWLFLHVKSGDSDLQALRMQVYCDSLSQANREQELHIMQLETQVEDLEDVLSESADDLQNCLAGRKIQIRHIDGNILTSNPEY